jgi:flagellar protein FliO/FliZ
MTTLSVNGVDSFAQVMTVLLIFVFVLALTYFVTRWIANYQKGKLSSGNIEVIETQRISQNRYVQIVRIGEKYFALGIGKEEVQMLGEIAKEELNLQKKELNNFPDFKKIFNNIKKS